MALLGILIIEKNGSNYLKLILDNLTSLSNFNWSLIDIYFYDDNSTDDSVKILNEIKKTLPIKVISGKYNDGLMHARLELMKICNDDFIILMDVDDTLSKNTFSAFLNSYKNHDLLMLKRKYIGSNHEKVFSNSYNENKSFLDNILTNVRLQFITGMFLKRNIYKEIVKILEKKDIHNIFIAEDITPNLIAISLAKEPCFLDAYYNYFLTNSSSITN
ncbi:glycosyltransferase family 2 protein [bacterium]|nr:glycosyltransferase family 2 protein [bacterium]